MKKIILVLLICLFFFPITGCNLNDESNKEELTNEKLVTELLNLKKQVKNEKSNENLLESGDTIVELKAKILNMPIEEFETFSNDYKSINFKAYSFLLFEETLCIVVKYSDDLTKIEKVEIINNFIPNQLKVDSLKVGMNVFELIEIMGYPYVIVLSSINAMDFKIETGEIIRILFDEKLLIKTIQNIDLELELIKNPTYTVDDKCGSGVNKPELSKATLITENMLFDEIVELIGNPHKTFGSGAIWYEWTLKDEKLLQIMFSPNDFSRSSLKAVKIIYR